MILIDKYYFTFTKINSNHFKVIHIHVSKNMFGNNLYILERLDIH